MLHEANIVATCMNCHPGSNERFAQYLPHATHDDRELYPEIFYAYWGMTLLLLVVVLVLTGLVMRGSRRHVFYEALR